jgi:hypothetical protein
MSALVVHLHPLAALGTIAVAVYVASLGFRSRRPRRDAEAVRRRHAAIMPWVYASFLVNWAGGLATVRWMRPELEATESGHFALGSALVALFTLTALLSRRVSSDPRARILHPLVGAAALVLCGVQIFLGLQLLP